VTAVVKENELPCPLMMGQRLLAEHPLLLRRALKKLGMIKLFLKITLKAIAKSRLTISRNKTISDFFLSTTFSRNLFRVPINPIRLFDSKSPKTFLELSFSSPFEKTSACSYLGTKEI
jgi:hypothetical protein